MTKEEANKIKEGQHFWALLEGELVITVKSNRLFFICTSWKSPIAYNELTFIETVNKPKGYEKTEFYVL